MRLGAGVLAIVLVAGSGSARTPIQPQAGYQIRLANRSFTPSPQEPQWDVLVGGAPRVHVIVQLTELPAAQTRAALRDAGIVLGQPLSGRAYFATVARTVNRTAPVLRAIRWAGNVQPDDKLAPELRRLSATSPALSLPGRIQLVVKLFVDGDTIAVAARIRAGGGEVVGEVAAAHTLIVTMPLGQEQILTALDDVRFVEPLPASGVGESDRARTHVGATTGPIPAGDPDGTGVLVGVFDAQHVSTTHSDLSGRVLTGDIGTILSGQHPTMTAGMIAGNGSRSSTSGAASAFQWRGIAPAAGIRSYNFTNTTDYVSDLTVAVTNDGIHVANNSWGTSGCIDFAYGSYAGRTPFVDSVVHGDLGRPVTVVFSAGNERSGVSGGTDRSCIANKTAPFANYTTVNHPKGAKNALVVGAIDSATNAMSSYSSWGPTLDGRLKPDIVASGHHQGTMTNGVSAIDNAFGMPAGAANQQGYRVPNFPVNPFVYAWFTQTSNAAAIASGAVSLLLDAWRRAFPAAAAPLPSTIRALLIHNAQDVDDATSWFNRGPDYASGYGLIRVNDTVLSLKRGEAQQGSVDLMETAHFTFTVPAGAGEVKITLVWDDPPAIENASPALINDLDLIVTDPRPTRRFPWTLDPASPSAAAVDTREDHVNNVEQVFVGSGVAAGVWKVDVRGTAVVQGPQSFSLVMTHRLMAPGPPTNLRIVQ